MLKFAAHEGQTFFVSRLPGGPACGQQFLKIKKGKKDTEHERVHFSKTLNTRGGPKRTPHCPQRTVYTHATRAWHISQVRVRTWRTPHAHDTHFMHNCAPTRIPHIIYAILHVSHTPWHMSEVRVTTYTHATRAWHISSVRVRTHTHATRMWHTFCEGLRPYTHTTYHIWTPTRTPHTMAHVRGKSDDLHTRHAHMSHIIGASADLHVRHALSTHILCMTAPPLAHHIPYNF